MPIESDLIPSDWLLAGFNFVMALVWLPLIETAALAGWLVAAHLAAALLPLLLARRQLSPPVAWLREFYPLPWILAFWSEADLHNQFITTTVNDALIARLDHAMFGATLHLSWIALMPWPALNGLMQASYLAYYPLFIGVCLLVFATGRQAAIREMCLRLCLSYLACYLCYAIFPVNGPNGDLSSTYPLLAANPFYRLNHSLHVAGDSLGTSFPSSHVAASVAFAWVAWKALPRWQAVMATTIAALIVVATVYTQYHFAIDSAIGLILGVVLQWVVAPVLQERGESR